MINLAKIRKRKALWLMKMGTVALVMIVVATFAFLISGAAAQGHNNHMEWHYHSAYVAAQKMREAETRRAEQKVKSEGAEKKAEVAAPADVITEDFEEGHTSNCRIVMVKEDTKC
jgi:hypothetical protein